MEEKIFFQIGDLLCLDRRFYTDFTKDGAGGPVVINKIKMVDKERQPNFHYGFINPCESNPNYQKQEWCAYNNIDIERTTKEFRLKTPTRLLKVPSMPNI